MWNRREIAQLLLTAGLVSGSAAADQAPPAAQPRARRAEVDALRQFAEATHPRGREAAQDKDWRARWEALLVQADDLSDGAYFVRVRRALGWFKDGHTTLLPFEFVGGVPPALASWPFSSSLPISVRVCHDGAWIVEAPAAAKSLLGARVTRVGALETGELLRAFAEQWPGNDAWAHRWSASPFSSPALLQGLGAIDDTAAPVQFEGQSGGKTLKRSLAPTAQGKVELLQVARQSTQVEGWASAAGVGNFTRLLPERGALYLSIDDMDNVEGKTFEAFTREAFDALSAPGVKRLVVDLRRNRGGNNYFAEALRKRIAFPVQQARRPLRPHRSAHVLGGTELRHAAGTRNIRHVRG